MITKNNQKKVFFIAVIVIAFIFLAAVINHSVQEIHYLKSFFPETFTMQEAKDAAVIELVKVTIISIPVIVGIGICWVMMKNRK